MKSLIYKNSSDTPIRPFGLLPFSRVKKLGEKNIEKYKLKFLKLEF